MTLYRSKAKFERVVNDGSTESNDTLSSWGLDLDPTMLGVYVFRDEGGVVSAILSEQEAFDTYETVPED